MLAVFTGSAVVTAVSSAAKTPTDASDVAAREMEAMTTRTPSLIACRPTALSMPDKPTRPHGDGTRAQSRCDQAEAAALYHAQPARQTRPRFAFAVSRRRCDLD